MADMSAFEPVLQNPLEAVVKPRPLLRFVEWARGQDEAIDEHLWRGIYEISLRGKPRDRLRAAKLLADRLRPLPPAAPVTDGRPVTLNVVVVNSDHAGHEAAPYGGRLRLGNSERPSPRHPRLLRAR